MKTLGKRLKEYRESCGLTVAEVALKIGVPSTTYREWEYGRAIRGEPYIALSKVLNVGLYELLSGQKSKSPPPLLNQWEDLESQMKKFRSNLLLFLEDEKSF